MPRTRKIRVPSVILFGTLLLAGCNQIDPYQRSGTWKPAGVNDANIAAQAANPGDLVQGHGMTDGNRRVATGAVTRIWQGAPAQSSGSASPLAAVLGAAGGSNPQAPR